ncbi:ABC transporter ATP-binding protein [Paenibacillus albiflavus]|uniref:ABC transporter ATP-binding protein n=1 Tax=Paenibacillus albiflavus TaxID=2545760 RepID=A0A4R4ECU5_9BACL|nr:ABC transporter ATP-binding protein [Paenibacillus albiflavus]TCZ77774.1 ABC transporter ATP-binding protein [Paenibacillus albiflavus]
MNQLVVENITYSYKNSAAAADKRHVPVLQNISLTVPKGKFVSIIGPSGCGKSTLFQVIGGLIKPDQGQVYIDGQQTTGKKGQISYMPQQPALFPWRTIEDNVILPLEIAGRSKSEARKEAIEWLSKVGLTGYEKAHPSMLSGGMQQRVAFLRALLSEQELMCLDEPFSALDALTRMDMQRWLLEIWEESRRSVLFITHNIEEALLLSDTIYLFSNRPAQVLSQIDVTFERPRSEDLLTTRAFIEMKQMIYEQMKRQQLEQRNKEMNETGR